MVTAGRYRWLEEWDPEDMPLGVDFVLGERRGLCFLVAMPEPLSAPTLPP